MSIVIPTAPPTVEDALNALQEQGLSGGPNMWTWNDGIVYFFFSYDMNMVLLMPEGWKDKTYNVIFNAMTEHAIDKIEITYGADDNSPLYEMTLYNPDTQTFGQEYNMEHSLSPKGYIIDNITYGLNLVEGHLDDPGAQDNFSCYFEMAVAYWLKYTGYPDNQATMNVDPHF